MLRVLNCASNRWNSAITEYALSTGRGLKAKGAEVLNLGLFESPFTHRSNLCGIETKTLPSFSVAQSLRFKQIVSDFNPGVIITHGGPETMLAGLASASAVPVVRVRGYAFDGSGILAGMTHDLGQWGARAIVVPGRPLEEELRRASKLPIHTITLGIDTEKYKSSIPWTPPERPEVLIFGRFDPVKGHLSFMKIFKRILEVWGETPKPLLRITGLPANISEKHLIERAIEVGLKPGEDVLISTEQVQRPEALLSDVTVGVVSSLGSEVICRVSQEFLACGTPVIVSGVGSLEDLLTDPSYGISYRGLSEEESAKALAKAIEAFQAETAAMRQKRSDRAREQFSFDVMGDSFKRVMASIL